MARKKRGSGNMPEKKAEAKGESTPLDNHPLRQAKDIAEDVATHHQAQVSESRYDGGFSILDMLDIRRALRYLLSLVEPRIPERYRRKFPLFVALVVVLIGLGYLVHTYWWLIVGTPDICGIIYNNSNDPDAVPREGLLYIYETPDSNMYCFHADFQIRHSQVEVGDSESVSVKPQQRLPIKLRIYHPTLYIKKDFYKYYRRGNVYAELTFFPDRMREYTLDRIPLNKKILTSKEPAFSLELIGKDIPAVQGTVFNASDDDDDIPKEGRFYICDKSDPDTEILNGLFEIQLPHVQQDEDEPVPIKAGERRQIQLMLPQTMELYKIYRKGDFCLALTFFPARRREFTLGERIRFNKKTLTSEESLFAFDLIGKEALWRSPSIKVCFATDERESDPNCRRSLERTKKLLEREAMRSGWFRIVSCKEFEKCKESFDAYVKRPESERINIAGGDPALRYRDWPTVVQVIVGLSREDSQTQWISVTDAQSRILKEKDEKEGEWPGHFGETPDQMKEEIEKMVNRLRRTIVRRYPIRGEITGIVENEGYRIAILNVGSIMGVVRDMRFDVLSEGTDRPTGATIEVRVVSTGEEARGRLKDGDDIEAGARARSTED